MQTAVSAECCAATTWDQELSKLGWRELAALCLWWQLPRCRGRTTGSGLSKLLHGCSRGSTQRLILLLCISSSCHISSRPSLPLLCIGGSCHSSSSPLPKLLGAGASTHCRRLPLLHSHRKDVHG